MIPSWEERKNEKDNYYFEDYEIKPLHIIFFMSNYGFSFGNRRENIVVLFFFFFFKQNVFFKPRLDETTDAAVRVGWVFAIFVFFQYFLDTTASSGIDGKYVGAVA